MASKAGIIAAAFFAILGILLVCIVCGGLSWAGGCNIAGVTFDSIEARDSLPAMLGNAFWGWIVCPFSLILIGLLGYAGYRVCKYAHHEMKGSSGNEPEQNKTNTSGETKQSEPVQNITTQSIETNE